MVKVKVNFTLQQVRSSIGGVKFKLYSLFNLGAIWGCVFNASPRLLYPRERPGTYCIGGWVGRRAGLDVCEKSRPQQGFYPRTVQPVASRYIDWDIPAL
jgi:hypothetical protein